MSSSEDNHHREANDQHWQCKKLASREGSQIKSDVSVGLPHEFHEESERSIKPNQRPRHRPGIEILPIKPLHNKKQNQAFEESFVKL
jgi:hypothetical protein